MSILFAQDVAGLVCFASLMMMGLACVIAVAQAIRSLYRPKPTIDIEELEKFIAAKQRKERRCNKR